MNVSSEQPADLAGRVIIVTGGASGIGRATVRKAAARGAKVVALDVDQAAIDATRQIIAEQGGEFEGLIADVTEPQSVETALNRTEDRFGAIDGLVCSAGTAAERPFLDLTMDVWNRVVTLNLTGTFVPCQAVAKRMTASGARGSIVTISSGLGVAAHPDTAPYSASKAGVIGLTRSMALALAPGGVRVNCVAPGGVETPLMTRVLEARPGGRELALSRVPLGRFGEPGDLASMICFLLSDEASWITGQTMHVNGGSVMV